MICNSVTLILLSALAFGASTGAVSQSVRPLVRKPVIPHSAQVANAPQIIWQSVLTGYQSASIVGSGAGRVAVLGQMRPHFDPRHYTPTPNLLKALDVKTGRGPWGKEIFGGDFLTTADDKFIYARIEVPLVSYDQFDLDPNRDIRYEIYTFRWSDGHLEWHIPRPHMDRLLACNGELIYDRAGQKPTDVGLAAVNANTGEPKWTSNGGAVNGLFFLNSALYAYDDSRDPEGEYLHTLDPDTGIVSKTIPFYPVFRPLTHLNSLAWFPNSQLFVGAIANDRTPGSNDYEVRAVSADGRQVWNRPKTGAFNVVGDVLVCRGSAGGPGSYGLIGLDYATGRELWHKPAMIDYGGNYDVNVGTWRGQAVVLLGGKLCGLNAKTGKTLWTVNVLPPNVHPVKYASTVGDVIIITIDAFGNQPARVIGVALK